MPLALAEFSPAHFAPLVDATVAFERPESPGERASLILREVKELGASPAPGLRAPFSLLFELCEGRPLSLHPHVMHAGDFEPCHLLITPVADPVLMRQHPGARFYEVVFA